MKPSTKKKFKMIFNELITNWKELNPLQNLHTVPPQVIIFQFFFFDVCIPSPSFSLSLSPSANDKLWKVDGREQRKVDAIKNSVLDSTFLIAHTSRIMSSLHKALRFKTSERWKKMRKYLCSRTYRGGVRWRNY